MPPIAPQPNPLAISKPPQFNTRLNYHPLVEKPVVLFSRSFGVFSCQRGDFPVAEVFHESSLKIPVWHWAKNPDVEHQYGEAFRAVALNSEELLYR